MKLLRIAAVARKESMHIARDPRTLAILVVLPIVLLLLFGYAIDLDVNEVRFGVYDEDRSPESRRTLEIFEQSGYFTPVFSADSAAAGHELLDREQIDAFIHIREGFSRALLRGENARLGVHIDGANPQIGANVYGLVEATTAAVARELGSSGATGAVDSEGVQPQSEARQGGVPGGAGRRPEGPGAAAPERDGIQSTPGAANPAEPGRLLRSRVWYNPQLESAQFLVPGLIAMILVITAVVSTAVGVSRERESGSMEQLRVSPLAPLEFILGKSVPYAVISALVAALVIVLGIQLFGVHVAGSLLALAAATLLFLIACLGLGLLISTVARTQQVAFVMSVLITFLPTFLLSGFVFPIRNMPLPIQNVSRIVPARYYLESLRRIMLKGGSFDLAAEELLFLAAFALITGFLALVRLRRIVNTESGRRA